jgi:hypothetical protein
VNAGSLRLGLIASVIFVACAKKEPTPAEGRALCVRELAEFAHIDDFAPYGDGTYEDAVEFMFAGTLVFEAPAFENDCGHVRRYSRVAETSASCTARAVKSGERVRAYGHARFAKSVWGWSPKGCYYSAPFAIPEG